ncbi:galactose-1-phosphate uridylyltransferase [Nitratifractor sp.]
MSEIRYDRLHDDYVIIAPERLHRPDCASDQRTQKEETPSRCPFCEGHEAMTPPEIFALRDKGEANAPGWRTRVVPNLYKAVRIEAPWQSHGRGPYDLWEGFGAHEVIVDTPRHLRRMDAWTSDERCDWLTTLRSRLVDLRKDLRLVHFSLFKNHGRYGGATQSHPHSQLIALPVVPKSFLNRMHTARDYRQIHGHSLFQGVLDYEEESGDRIVASDGQFVALCPYASQYAFEVQILATREGIASLVDLDGSGIEALAETIGKVMEALYRELGDFDFNILFNTPPMQKNIQTDEWFDEIPQFWRLGVRILPRLYNWGGFELESGMRINPVVPEEAARLLRDGK